MTNDFRFLGVQSSDFFRKKANRKANFVAKMPYKCFLLQQMNEKYHNLLHYVFSVS